MKPDPHTEALTSKIRELERRCGILQETVRMQGRFADIAGILSSAVDLPKLASSLLDGVFSATQLKAGLFLLPAAQGSVTVIESQGIELEGGGLDIVRLLAHRASRTLDIVTEECTPGTGVILCDEMPGGGLSLSMLAAVSCRYEGVVNSILVFASPALISLDALSFINALSKNVGLSVNNALSYETIKRTTEELNSERNKLNAVMYNMADGLLVTDTNGTIVRVNRACLEMFGYGKENMAGRPVDKVFGPALRELVGRGLGAGKRNAVSLEIDMPGGGIAKALATPLAPESDATCTGVVILIRDITREKEVDRMKTDFLATVSHELRTPLTSILGFARIIRKKMRDTVLPSIADEGPVRQALRQVNDNIEIITSEGERLTALINDVLDLAKMEAGRIDLKKAQVPVADLIHHAAASTAALIEQKELKLIISVESTLPRVYGDKNRLIQVLINLLSNAVKFTERGSITLGACRKDGMVVVSVKDTGIGIAETDLPKIFEKFKQVGDTLTGKPKGTGLGLPICREIVAGHGGTIWVQSEPGKGSEFFVSIPAGDNQ